MALAIATITNATTMAATDITSRVLTIENFINGGIVAADLTATTWVTARHIYKPDFFPGVAPRVVLTSSETHYRVQDDTRANIAVHHFEGYDTSWIPVRGLSVSFRIPDNRSASSTYYATLYLSYYAWEEGGVSSGFDETGSNYAAVFGVFIDADNTARATSARQIHRGGYQSTYKRHQHVWIYQIPLADLTVGTHHVSVRCQVKNDQTKHIYVSNRVMIVDLRLF